METPLQDRPARPLMIVGGDVALDFANTVDDPYGPAHFDHLIDLPGLLAWAEAREVITGADRVVLAEVVRRRRSRSAIVLRDAHRLRAAIQSAFGAAAADRPVPDDAWHLIRADLAAGLAHAHLERQGDTLRPAWDFVGPDALLWPVAYAAHQLLTGDRLDRVKRCAGCPWLYVDQSKNSSRRWCTMDDCGKNAKMRRYVERRAVRRQSGS